MAKDIEEQGYRLVQEVEYENDNKKIYQDVYLPDGTRIWLDHTPYEYIDRETFRKYIAYYELHGRFPTRKDINSIGPLCNGHLSKLLSD